MNKTIKDLSFENFSNLLKFLNEEFDKKTKGQMVVGEENRSEFILFSMKKFFPELNATQEMVFSNLIMNPIEEDYNSFVEANPNIYVDSTGKSTPKKVNYWEITLESLEKLFEVASNVESPISNQIINGKTLQCLCEKRYPGYTAVRKLFLKKYHSVLEEWKLVQLEEFFKNYFGKKEAALILGQFIGYCWEHQKAFRQFLNHFVCRTDSLIAEFMETKRVENQVNIEFSENLEKIIKQFFIKNEEEV